MKIDLRQILIISILWMLSFYFLFIMMASCSAEYHLKRAIDKGAVIKADTSYKYIYDTDTLYDVKTNTYTITRTIVDSIPYSVTKKIYVPMSRQERMKYRDSLSHIRKLYELETKRVKVQVKEKIKIQKTPTKIVRNLMFIILILGALYIYFNRRR